MVGSPPGKENHTAFIVFMCCVPHNSCCPIDSVASIESQDDLPITCIKLDKLLCFDVLCRCLKSC